MSSCRLDLAELKSLPSQSSGRCAGLIEGCWLVAVGLVPLLYDSHGWGAFEQIKMVVTRMLGLLVAGALLVEWAGGREGRVFRGLGAVLGVSGGLLGAWVLASCFSVNSANSWWGAFVTVEGTITLACQLALFLGAAAHFRHPEQIERLVVTLLACSVPTSIYAILQRTGFDPLFNTVGPGAHSFPGQVLHLAGYTLMVLPLAVWWLVRCSRDSSGSLWRKVYSLAFAAGVTALLLGAFASAEKRGPFIALAASIGVACVFSAVWLRRRVLVVWGAGAVLGVALFLVGLVAAGKAGWRVDDVPFLRTLAKIVPFGDGTGDAYRDQIWREAPALVLSDRPIVMADGSTDRFHALRRAIGYGPETLQDIIPQHWPFDAENVYVARIEHRFHNWIWDLWQTVGLLGMAATIGFVVLVFAYGYKALGFLPGRFGRGWLGGVAVGAGLLGGAGITGLYGPGYFGLGFQYGFAVGLVLLPLALFLAQRMPPVKGGGEETSSFLLVSLIAVLAHWLCLAFVFPSATTSALFFVLSGVVVGLALGPRTPASSVEEARGSTADSPAWLAGLLAGGALAVVAHGLIKEYSMEAVTVGSVLKASLVEARHGFSVLLGRFVIPSWLAVTALLV